MNSLIKSILLIVISIYLTSCIAQRPIQKAKPGNNLTYDVEYLFEYEGCKVYRFYDMGNYVYFTNCNGDVTSITADSAKTRNTNSIKNIPRK